MTRLFRTMMPDPFHTRQQADQVTFAMLRLVGNHPGQIGRLRCARIVDDTARRIEAVVLPQPGEQDAVLPG